MAKWYLFVGLPLADVLELLATPTNIKLKNQKYNIIITGDIVGCLASQMILR